MNKKGFKVYTINGVSGFILLGLLFMLVVFVFFVFPIFGITEIWNYFIGYYFGGPKIGYLQAFLLWLAAAISAYVILRSFISLNIQQYDSDNIDDLDNFFEQIADKENIQKDDVKK